MADDNFKTFSDALKNLDIFKELEETRRNQNDTNEHEIQINSSLDCDRNLSASSVSRETGVASSLATPLSIQGFGSSFDIPAWASIGGAQRGSSEHPEENPAISFLAPLETARSYFCRTDENQSNPSESFSNQKIIGKSNGKPAQKKRPRNASFAAEDSTHRRKGINPEEFFPRTKTSHSDSTWPPQISVERDRNEATAQTEEDYRELSSTSSVFSPIDDIQSINVDTHKASLVSVVAAEEVSVAGPSGIQTLSPQAGKEKPIKCEVCGKTFGQKGHLDDHKRTHTGGNPFVCNKCGKGFAHKGNLRRHLRTHTGEKPFVCDICGKGFAQKVSLDSHRLTHSGEKPFKCKFCDKWFAQKNNCIRHQKVMHVRM